VGGATGIIGAAGVVACAIGLAAGELAGGAAGVAGTLVTVVGFAAAGLGTGVAATVGGALGVGVAWLSTDVWQPTSSVHVKTIRI
jgi:hypothetical protein